MNISRNQYLHEDLEQIQRYFPGAKPVALRTPFDLTPKARRIMVDMFRDEPLVAHSWKGRLRWMA